MKMLTHDEARGMPTEKLWTILSNIYPSDALLDSRNPDKGLKPFPLQLPTVQNPDYTCTPFMKACSKAFDKVSTFVASLFR